MNIIGQTVQSVQTDAFNNQSSENTKRWLSLLKTEIGNRVTLDNVIERIVKMFPNASVYFDGQAVNHIMIGSACRTIELCVCNTNADSSEEIQKRISENLLKLIHDGGQCTQQHYGCLYESSQISIKFHHAYAPLACTAVAGLFVDANSANSRTLRALTNDEANVHIKSKPSSQAPAQAKDAADKGNTQLLSYIKLLGLLRDVQSSDAFTVGNYQRLHDTLSNWNREKRIIGDQHISKETKEELNRYLIEWIRNTHCLEPTNIPLRDAFIRQAIQSDFLKDCPRTVFDAVATLPTLMEWQTIVITGYAARSVEEAFALEEYLTNYCRLALKQSTQKNDGTPASSEEVAASLHTVASVVKHGIESGFAKRPYLLIIAIYQNEKIHPVVIPVLQQIFKEGTPDKQRHAMHSLLQRGQYDLLRALVVEESGNPSEDLYLMLVQQCVDAKDFDPRPWLTSERERMMRLLVQADQNNNFVLMKILISGLDRVRKTPGFFDLLAKSGYSSENFVMYLCYMMGPTKIDEIECLFQQIHDAVCERLRAGEQTDDLKKLKQVCELLFAKFLTIKAYINRDYVAQLCQLLTDIQAMKFPFLQSLKTQLLKDAKNYVLGSVRGLKLARTDELNHLLVEFFKRNEMFSSLKRDEPSQKEEVGGAEVVTAEVLPIPVHKKPSSMIFTRKVNVDEILQSVETLNQFVKDALNLTSEDISSEEPLISQSQNLENNIQILITVARKKGMKPYRIIWVVKHCKRLLRLQYEKKSYDVTVVYSRSDSLQYTVAKVPKLKIDLRVNRVKIMSATKASSNRLLLMPPSHGTVQFTPGANFHGASKFAGPRAMLGQVGKPGVWQITPVPKYFPKKKESPKLPEDPGWHCVQNRIDELFAQDSMVSLRTSLKESVEYARFRWEGVQKLGAESESTALSATSKQSAHPAYAIFYWIIRCNKDRRISNLEVLANELQSELKDAVSLLFAMPQTTEVLNSQLIIIKLLTNATFNIDSYTFFKTHFLNIFDGRKLPETIEGDEQLSLVAEIMRNFNEPEFVDRIVVLLSKKQSLLLELSVKLFIKEQNLTFTILLDQAQPDSINMFMCAHCGFFKLYQFFQEEEMFINIVLQSVPLCTIHKDFQKDFQKDLWIPWLNKIMENESCKKLFLEILGKDKKQLSKFIEMHLAIIAPHPFGGVFVKELISLVDQENLTDVKRVLKIVFKHIEVISVYGMYRSSVLSEAIDFLLAFLRKTKNIPFWQEIKPFLFRRFLKNVQAQIAIIEFIRQLKLNFNKQEVTLQFVKDCYYHCFIKKSPDAAAKGALILKHLHQQLRIHKTTEQTSRYLTTLGATIDELPSIEESHLAKLVYGHLEVAGKLMNIVRLCDQRMNIASLTEIELMQSFFALFYAKTIDDFIKKNPKTEDGQFLAASTQKWNLKQWLNNASGAEALIRQNIELLSREVLEPKVEAKKPESNEAKDQSKAAGVSAKSGKKKKKKKVAAGS